MANFIVSYDLRKPGRNYDELYKAIKAYGTWAHLLESVWMISSLQDVGKVRDSLTKHVDANDIVLVIECDVSNWASRNLPQNQVDWLKKRAA